MSQPAVDCFVALLAGRDERPGEWDALIAIARAHGLGPWLGKRLKTLAVDLPPAAAEALDELRVASAAHNLRLLERVDTILGTLAAAGIPVAVLKGAWLARDVYDDAALRPMGDIDLWVPRERIGEARASLEALGYAADEQADRPQALQDALTGETRMRRADSPIVELHWNAFPGEWIRHAATIDEREVWERASRAVAGGIGESRHARALATEDAVIHLCVHLAVNHQMSLMGLRTLIDLDTLRRARQVDWGEVARRARAWRVAGAVWIVLRALADLIGDAQGELPLADLAPPRWRRAIMTRIAPPRALAEGLELRTGRARFLLLLALADRPSGAAVLGWRALCPDRTWLGLRYGEPGASAWRMVALRLRHLARILWHGEV